MAKLMSQTTNATVAVSPDGISIIFSNNKNEQVFWPSSDWPDLKAFIDRHYMKHHVEKRTVDINSKE